MLFIVALLLTMPARGQAPGLEARLPAAAEALRQEYSASTVNYPYLYNGPEYADYTRKYHTRTGHPYFLQATLLPGTATYDGREFANLQLQYDLVLDQVVLAQPNNPLRLRFINEKMHAFSVDGHRFVRLVAKADSASADVIRTGYYELLAEGPVQVLARHSKTLYEHINKPYIDASFSETHRLYMQKAGRYYAVRSKSVALRLFADRSAAMQQYLKEHRLRFNKASRESSVVELAHYYNGLRTQ